MARTPAVTPWSTPLLVALLLVAAAPATAQDRRPRPAPTFAIPQREPTPGRPHPGAGNPLCQDPDRQPSISLTLSAEEVFPGDRVTLFWSVRPREVRPGASWGWDVTLSADFAVDPALPTNPVAVRGNHTFTVAERPHQGSITLATFCGQETVRLRVATAPSLYLVSPEKGPPGTNVRLRGARFGEHRWDSGVDLRVGVALLPMEIVSWSDDVSEVLVPDNAPRGGGSITVRKGGRLASRSQPFQVIGARVITNQDVQLIAAGLGLGETAVRLHQGENGCTVNFSDELNAAGVDDAAFTGPSLVRAVGDSFLDLVSTVLAAGFIPKRVFYQLNDFNSNEVTVALNGTQLTLEVHFESRGRELLGDLQVCAAIAPSDCAREDRLAPDVDLDKAVITIRAALGLSNGRIQVTSLTPEFDAEVRLGGGGLDQDLAEAVTDFSEHRVKQEVERGIRDAVDTPQVRRAIADAIMDQLEVFGIQRIVSLAPSGDDLRVEYE